MFVYEQIVYVFRTIWHLFVRPLFVTLMFVTPMFVTPMFVARLFIALLSIAFLLTVVDVMRFNDETCDVGSEGSQLRTITTKAGSSEGFG